MSKNTKQNFWILEGPESAGKNYIQSKIEHNFDIVQHNFERSFDIFSWITICARKYEEARAEIDAHKTILWNRCGLISECVYSFLRHNPHLRTRLNSDPKFNANVIRDYCFTTLTSFVSSLFSEKSIKLVYIVDNEKVISDKDTAWATTKPLKYQESVLYSTIISRIKSEAVAFDVQTVINNKKGKSIDYEQLLGLS